MAIRTGEKTVTATATRVIASVAGTTNSLGSNGAIIVQPLAANTDAVTYFGGSNVSAANGYPVAKGVEKSFTAQEIGELYLIGVTTTDKVRWITLGRE